MTNSTPIRPGDLVVGKATNKVHTVISVDFGQYLTLDTGSSIHKSECRTPEQAMERNHAERISLIGQLEELKKQPMSPEEIAHRREINEAHKNRLPLYWKKRYPYPNNARNDWEELPDSYRDFPLDWELNCYMRNVKPGTTLATKEELDVIYSMLIFKNIETGYIDVRRGDQLDDIDPASHKVLSLVSKVWV